MRGACAICMGMCGSGCRIGTQLIITNSGRIQIKILRDLIRGNTELPVAARGSIARESFGAFPATGVVLAPAMAVSVFGLSCVHETLNSETLKGPGRSPGRIF